jgi:hypothetical protein
MSEARDFGNEHSEDVETVHLDLSGLVRRMRLVGADLNTQEIHSDTGDTSLVGDKPAALVTPEGTVQRAVGRQRKVRMDIPGMGVVLLLDREVYIVVSPDDERLEGLEDDADEDKEPGTLHAPVPDVHDVTADDLYVTDHEDDRPLGLGATFRILGARALGAVKRGLDGMVEEYGDKSERRYRERQRESAVRRQYANEPAKVRVIRTQLDAYFELIASGGLNTWGRLPDQVVHWLQQMDKFGYPYYGDFQFNDQEEF